MLVKSIHTWNISGISDVERQEEKCSQIIQQLECEWMSSLIPNWFWHELLLYVHLRNVKECPYAVVDNAPSYPNLRHF